MKIKKVLLVLFMSVFISSIFSVVTNAATYRDIPGHWAEKEIEKWSYLGILKGSQGKFNPNGYITRGELAVILDRIMNYQTMSANAFSDLKNNQFYTESILKANRAGIILGNNSTLRPTSRVTREEAVVIIARAFGVDEVTTAKGGFKDSDKISYWALGAVNGMKASKYITGKKGNLFDPKTYISRAEIVKIIDVILNNIISSDDIYKKDVAGNLVVNVPNAVLKDLTVKGNLIISEGVAEGYVVLDNVVVTGKTIIRGGGAESVELISSKVSNVYLERVDGTVKLSVDSGSSIGGVYFTRASAGGILTGKYNNILISADNVPVRFVKATATNLDVESPYVEVNIDAQSSIDGVSIQNKAEQAYITVQGNISTIDTASPRSNIIVVDNGKVGSITSSSRAEYMDVRVDGTGTVSNITSNGAYAKVAGTGTIQAAVFGGNNSRIDTKGTKLEVLEGVTGTVSGNITVEGGSNIVTDINTTIVKISRIAITPFDSLMVGVPQKATVYYSGGQPVSPNITWQWYEATSNIAADSSTGWTAISGATADTYTPTTTGKYIKVIAKGSSGVEGTATLKLNGPVLAGADKTSLKKAIDDYKFDSSIKADLNGNFVYTDKVSSKKSAYTASSWTGWERAYNNALKISENTGATSSEITSAEASLRSAYNTVFNSSSSLAKVEAPVVTNNNDRTVTITTKTAGAKIMYLDPVTGLSVTSNTNTVTVTDIPTYEYMITARGVYDGYIDSDIVKHNLNSVYKATINIYLNDGLSDVAGSVELKSGSSTITLSKDSTGVYSGYVETGKYNVWVDGRDTGKIIELRNTPWSEDIKFYTVKFGVTDLNKGVISGVVNVAGRDMSITSEQTWVLAGSQVTFTVRARNTVNPVFVWRNNNITLTGAVSNGDQSTIAVSIVGGESITCDVS